MPDMLIRDLPEDVMASLDARASLAGLSRSEYVRRLLAQQVQPDEPRVTVDDFHRLADTFRDARDPEIMDAMWR